LTKGDPPVAKFAKGDRSNSSSLSWSLCAESSRRRLRPWAAAEARTHARTTTNVGRMFDARAYSAECTFVAAELCGGLRGSIITRNGQFYVPTLQCSGVSREDAGTGRADALLKHLFRVATRFFTWQLGCFHRGLEQCPGRSHHYFSAHVMWRSLHCRRLGVQG
jgi:hypothetical protein